MEPESDEVFEQRTAREVAFIVLPIEAPDNVVVALELVGFDARTSWRRSRPSGNVFIPRRK